MEKISGFVSFLRSFGCLISIGGCFLNILCLLSLKVGRKFGNHNLNCLLFYHAFLDLAVAIFHVLYTFLFLRVHGDVLCRIVNSAFPLWFLVYIDAGFLIILLADRYIAIAHPSIYRSLGIVLILRFSITGVMIHALLQSAVHLASMNVVGEDSSPCEEVNLQKYAETKEIVGFIKADAMTKLVGCCLLPVTIILYCSLHIVSVLRRGLVGDIQQLSDSERFLTQTVRGLVWRGMVQGAAIVIQGISAAIVQFASGESSISTISITYQLGLFCVCICSSIGPAITLAMRPDCRKHIAHLLRLRCLKKTPEHQQQPERELQMKQNALTSSAEKQKQKQQNYIHNQKSQNASLPEESGDSDSRQTRSSTVDRQTMTRHR